MNIKEWEARNKFPQVSEDFNHQLGINYDSNWEYTKTLSNYHFNKWSTDDSAWYEKLGRFNADWNSDLEYLKNNCVSKPLSKRPWTGAGVNPLLEQEKADMQIYGVGEEYSPYWHITSKQARENCPTFIKMVEFFKLERATFGVHVQKPGQFLHMHIDKFQQRNPVDTTKIVRIHINLEDYDFGQFWGYGTDVYSHWQRGEIIIEDCMNVPHCMINAGKLPVCWIGITGIRTESTDVVLENATKDSVYTV